MPSIWESMWPKRQKPVSAPRPATAGRTGRRRGTRATTTRSRSPIFWDSMFPIPRPGTFAPREMRESGRRGRRGGGPRSDQVRRFYEALITRRVWRTSELVEIGRGLGISRNYVYVLINRAQRAGLVRKPKRGVVVVVGHGTISAAFAGGATAEERIRSIEGDIARGAAYTGYVAAKAAERAARKVWENRGRVKEAASSVARRLSSIKTEAGLRARDAASDIRDRVETYSRSRKYYVGGSNE